MLYLNLKTQMYLSAISQEEQERSREEILDDLFPDNLAETLQARHPETPLSPNETDFVSEAKARREHLQGEPGDADSICEQSSFSPPHTH
jgi:protein TBF1